MARNKKPPSAEEGAYWMDTYGDMVTLLLTFFVLLFSMSSLNADKWEMFVKAFNGTSETAEQIVIHVQDPGEQAGENKVPPSGEGKTVGTVEKVEDIKTFEDLFLYMQKVIKDKGLEKDVTLTKGDGFTFIQFANNIFFDGNSANLRPEAKEIMDIMAEAFGAIPNQIKELNIYGHTAQENAKELNNLFVDSQLSSQRSMNVGLYLMNKDVLGREKYSWTGYGQYRPIVPHDGTEEARMKNRRVEFQISEEGAKSASLDDIYEVIKEGGTADDALKDAAASEAAASSKAASDAAASDAAASGGTASDGASSGTASSGASSTTSGESSGTESKPAASSESKRPEVSVTLPGYSLGTLAKDALKQFEASK